MSSELFSNTFWNLSRNIDGSGMPLDQYTLQMNPSISDSNKNIVLNIMKQFESQYDFIQLNTEKIMDIDDSGTKKSDNILSIVSQSIQSFHEFLSSDQRKNYMSYVDAISMVNSLGTTCIELQNNYNISIPFINPDEIFVLNGEIFLYLGSNYLNIQSNGMIPIHKPYKREYYFSPELMNIRALPGEISTDSWFYSFCMIVVYSMFHQIIPNTFVDERERVHNIERLKQIIQSIEATKLYYFLLRCADISGKRLFLFI
jgi:hypothetical protein